jgi:hypothetical protein
MRLHGRAGLLPGAVTVLLGGVERLRVRYRQYATPWYDVLFASREEVVRLVEGTGWVMSRFVDNGPGYVAVLDLETDLVRRKRE